MYQAAVIVPMGRWAESCLRNLSVTDRQRDLSRVGLGFGKNVSNWLGRESAYPINVLHLPTECANRQHSATFPPEFFISLFSQTSDFVVDPFVESGTTANAAKALGRHYLGIELDPQYCEMTERALAE
jgi:DNA modification methylase